MNRRWTPSARRNAFDYPPRFLQARNVALYVSCIQSVFLIWQLIFFRLPLSDQILNLRQQNPLSKTIFLTHESHKEKRAQRDMKTLPPNPIYSTRTQEIMRRAMCELLGASLCVSLLSCVWV
jgi:hypothetical protein